MIRYIAGTPKLVFSLASLTMSGEFMLQCKH
jgi:hypothetical protein